MALQGSWVYSKTNMAVADAYIRIGSISGTTDNLQLNIEGWFDAATRAVRDDLDPEVQRFPLGVEVYTFTPDLNGDNFFKQGYDYLKTLPEYSGYTDV